jgi:hypothetical protein
MPDHELQRQHSGQDPLFSLFFALFVFVSILFLTIFIILTAERAASQVVQLRILNFAHWRL